MQEVIDASLPVRQILHDLACVCNIQQIGESVVCYRSTIAHVYSGLMLDTMTSNKYSTTRKRSLIVKGRSSMSLLAALFMNLCQLQTDFVRYVSWLVQTCSNLFEYIYIWVVFMNKPHEYCLEDELTFSNLLTCWPLVKVTRSYLTENVDSWTLIITRMIQIWPNDSLRQDRRNVTLALFQGHWG